MKKNVPDAKTRLLREDIARGSLTVFWQLWGENRARFFQICLRQLRGDWDAAEDALSCILIKSIDVLPKHSETISHFTYWLSGLAYNYCKDIYRQRDPLYGAGNLEDLLGVNDDSTADPERDFFLKEESTWLNKLLAELPRPLREPLMLRFYECLPYPVIAARLGLTETCLRKRVQRARKVLLELVQNDSSSGRSLFLLEHERHTKPLDRRPQAQVSAAGPCRS